MDNTLESDKTITGMEFYLLSFQLVERLRVLVFSPKTLLGRSKSISIVCHHTVSLLPEKEVYPEHVHVVHCVLVLSQKSGSQPYFRFFSFLGWGVGGWGGDLSVCVGGGGSKLK